MKTFGPFAETNQFLTLKEQMDSELLSVIDFIERITTDLFNPLDILQLSEIERKYPFFRTYWNGDISGKEFLRLCGITL